MNWEYMAFNALVLTGPIAASFDRKVRYVTRWPTALSAAMLTMVPYILWDAAVNGRHWWFNEQFTLTTRMLGLPLGEWLFFISVPFACLFIWEIVGVYLRPVPLGKLRWIQTAMAVMVPLGVLVFLLHREYTGAVLIVLGLVGVADRWLKLDLLLQPRTYLYLGGVLLLTLLFNSYLTARPVVLYGGEYQLGVRIGSVPIEDFGYGLGLVLFNTLAYEKLRGRRRG